MKAVRRINNNVAVCVDSKGTELLAVGRGIGFGKLPKELKLDQIDQTFYNVDKRYIAAMDEISPEIIDFTIRAVAEIMGDLDGELTPNVVFMLADHLSFALERAREGQVIEMPLMYDVEHAYPREYRLARYFVRRAAREFGVRLPDFEVPTVAMHLANARIAPATPDELAAIQRRQDMLEEITEIVEEHFSLTVDRSSVAFARYAAHVRYLCERLDTHEALSSVSLKGFEGFQNQFPEGVSCVERIATHFEQAWNSKLTEDEKLYLLIHISRITR